MISPVNRHSGCSAIVVSKNVVAAAHTDHAETRLAEGRDQFAPGQARQSRHAATLTRSTAINSKLSGGSPEMAKRP